MPFSRTFQAWKSQHLISGLSRVCMNPGGLFQQFFTYQMLLLTPNKSVKALWENKLLISVFNEAIFNQLLQKNDFLGSSEKDWKTREAAVVDITHRSQQRIQQTAFQESRRNSPADIKDHRHFLLNTTPL